MKVEDLIKELEKYPKGTNVNLFDFRKCLHNDWGEGTHEGVYSDFEIHLEELSDEDEKEYFKENNGYEFQPWIALSFENNDYDNEGKCLLKEEE